MRIILWAIGAFTALALFPAAIFIARQEWRRAAARLKEWRRVEVLRRSILRLHEGHWILDPPCNSCGRLTCKPQWHHGATAQVVEFTCQVCGAVFAHKPVSELLAGVNPQSWSQAERGSFVGPEA